MIFGVLNIAFLSEQAEPAERYTTAVRDQMDTYRKLSSRKKYAQNADYHNFRDALWTASEEGAMPPVRDLISAEEGDEADSDEDIVAGGATQNFRCPITTNILEDPITKYVSFSHKLTACITCSPIDLICELQLNVQAFLLERGNLRVRFAQQSMSVDRLLRACFTFNIETRPNIGSQSCQLPTQRGRTTIRTTTAKHHSRLSTFTTDNVHKLGCECGMCDNTGRVGGRRGVKRWRS